MISHSVVLDYNRCRGCTTCIKTCPTEAIRVRRGKAIILNDRCIDCGRCIQACPHKAMRVIADDLSMMEQYKYKVAIPDPALYGQFQNMDDIDTILNGLLELGFDRVWEASKAAEMLSDYNRQVITKGEPRVMPQISSACPTVSRLISMRFPKLIDNVVLTTTPMKLAARLVRRELRAVTGLDDADIGVFGIVPCPAQVTAARNAAREDGLLSGAFPIQETYLKLLSPMKHLEKLTPMTTAGIVGVGWACCGGESAARLGEKYVAVDGMENVIRMLEEIEDGRLPDADFIELNACVEGCVGGCLTVENPFGAHMRIKKLMKGLPVSRNRFTLEGEDRGIIERKQGLAFVPAFVLDRDRGAAMEKLVKIDEFEAGLPGLHCGSCGAPSCHAFAEDVVLGRASEEDCIFKMRERMQYMTGDGDADDYLPAPFRKREKREKEETEQ